jgi:nucleoside-diphosphate-sugar epimerase
LTNHAYTKNKITVFGGNQKRPNIHIKDMVRAYVSILKESNRNVNSEIFNVGYENYSLDKLASMVIDTVKKNITLSHMKTDDLRSYHVSSDKIMKKINFKPIYTIQNAIEDLCNAFDQGFLPNSLDDPRYYNIKTMQLLNLK